MRQGDAPLLAAMRARGDSMAGGVSGRRAQQQRIFDIVPKPPAWAAMTRQFDCGDAAGSQWLRADPAQLQVEPGSLRLLAWGEQLAIDTAESRALAAALRPSFHDLGMLFSAPHPHRWYVELARGRPMPKFIDPEEALGAEGSPVPAAVGMTEGREWRRLLNETQVVLHDHPVNRERARRGVPQVNSLWLWGAGELPLKVASSTSALVGADAEYQALAQLAKLPSMASLGHAIDSKVPSVVVDARHAPRSSQLDAVLAAFVAGTFDSLCLDSEDGAVVEYRRWHRLRFWR